jgi:hypothetical protein
VELTRTKELRTVPLTVDISLAQVALITAETAALLRRLFAADRKMLELAQRIDRFLSARADTHEARMHAGELVNAWRAFLGTPQYREFSLAHSKQRGTLKQDQVERRIRQIDVALQREPVARKRTRRASPAA